MISIYTDTDAARCLSETFASRPLPLETRRQMLICPLSICELICQLITAEGERVLKNIQNMESWTVFDGGLALTWMDEAIAELGFGKRDDSVVAETVESAIRRLKMETNIERARKGAEPLIALINEYKDRQADAFTELYNSVRSVSQGARMTAAMLAELDVLWARGVARRGKEVLKTEDVERLKKLFAAYHEFESVKLRTAVALPYNARKNRNDAIDVEYLIYLADPRLVFLTCDQGFLKVTVTEQRNRIAFIRQEVMRNADACKAMIESLIAGGLVLG